MGSLSVVMLFARTQLVRALRLRRSWLVFVLVLLPSVIAAVLAQRAPRRVAAAEIAVHLAWFVYLQVIVPLVTLLAGTAVISREVDDRTITYLFSRPVSRAAMFLGRTLGALAFVWIVTLAGAAAILLLAAHGREGRTATPDLYPLAPWGADGVSLPFLEAVALGVLAYTSLFATLGVLFKHPMILGLAYTFAIEAFLSNLPGSSKALTIQFYLRSWVTDQGAPVWRKIESFGTASFEPGSTVLWKIALIAGAALALGTWRIRRKEFVLSA